MSDDANQRYNPAYEIVRLLGGLTATARICQRDYSSIYRWTIGRSRGGSAGIIPVPQAKKILRYARRNRIKIRAEDFFQPSTPVEITPENIMRTGCPPGKRRTGGKKNGTPKRKPKQAKAATVAAE